MAVVATVTIGVTNYSVYGLTSDAVADADAYMAAHNDAAEWTAASTTSKKQVLITAFRAIEREKWSGTLVDPTTPQATQWPRTGATKDGEAVPTGTPDDIALGQFEYALALLKDPTLTSKGDTASNVKKAEAGPAKVEFFYPLPGSTTRWPRQINSYLFPYLSGSSSGVSDLYKPYVGSGESSFTSLDADRSEPFA